MIDLIIQYGPALVFGLMVFNGIVSAPPSESTLMAGGLLVSSNNASWSAVFLAAILGNLVGATILYTFGRFTRESTAKRFWLTSWGRLKLMPHGSNRAEMSFQVLQRLYADNRILMLCILRCAPVIRSIVSLPAGIFRVPYAGFTLLTMAGASIWITLWMSVGIHFFDLYKQSRFVNIAVLCGGLFAAYILLKHVIKRHLSSIARNDES